jgi:hypothetical protein
MNRRPHSIRDMIAEHNRRVRQRRILDQLETAVALVTAAGLAWIVYHLKH